MPSSTATSIFSGSTRTQHATRLQLSLLALLALAAMMLLLGQSEKQGVGPAPKQDAEPAPSQDAGPAPKQDAEPAPKQDAEPAPKQDAEPAPKQDAEPAPKQDAEPAPSPSVNKVDQPDPDAMVKVLNFVLAAIGWMGTLYSIRRFRSDVKTFTEERTRVEPVTTYYDDRDTGNNNLPFDDGALNRLIEMVETKYQTTHRSAISHGMHLHHADAAELAEWRRIHFSTQNHESHFISNWKQMYTTIGKVNDKGYIALVQLTSGLANIKKNEFASPCELPGDWIKWRKSLGTKGQEQHFIQHWLSQYNTKEQYSECTKEAIMHLVSTHLVVPRMGFEVLKPEYEMMMKKTAFFGVLSFLFAVSRSIDIITPIAPTALWSALAELWDSTAMLELFKTAFPMTAQRLSVAFVGACTLVYLGVQFGKAILYGFPIVLFVLLIATQCKARRNELAAMGTMLVSMLYSMITTMISVVI